MNWDAIGAVAELLGAIGVIGSLIYLASQIRDTRRALRASTYQQLNDSMHTVMSKVVAVPGLADTVAAGLVDYDGLSDADRFHFIVWMNGVMRAYEGMHYQYRSGMLDADRWEIHQGDLQQMFAGPGARQWWRSQGQTLAGGKLDVAPAGFSREFSDLVSSIVAGPPQGGAN